MSNGLFHIFVVVARNQITHTHCASLSQMHRRGEKKKIHSCGGWICYLAMNRASAFDI